LGHTTTVILPRSGLAAHKVRLTLNLTRSQQSIFKMRTGCPTSW